MYDFILFENNSSLENHYVDLGNLAYLLKNGGYKVAFADIFKEKILVKEKGIDFVQLPVKYPTFLLAKKKHNPVTTFIYRFLSSLYLIYALFALRDKAKGFYIGSLTLGTPILWLLFLSSKKEYYIWGLRCHMLELWQHSRSLYGFYSFCLYKLIRKKKNLKIIVSHHIIKEEFISRLGIENSRLIARPERFNRGVSNNIRRTTRDTLTLLTIGTLRRSKHVEFVLDSLRKINIPNIKYIIAGRCKNDVNYEALLTKKMKGLSNVTRLNRFIPDEEYNELMNECDFLVLCDEQEPSCATNGTMTEALLNGIPIIAPNYNPFKYEIEKYGVGLIYEYNDINSMVEVINMAASMDCSNLRDNLYKYRILFSQDVVTKSLIEQIKQNQ
ncbi:MAG: glycosyltransferase [Prevotella sp.]|nr:glycosyltransferase [Candidatus Prevotella equi]